MSGVESEIREEIKKWSKRIREVRKNVRISDKRHVEFVKNIDAYIKDSAYFFERGELVKSFEAIIWAWAWVEILKELKIIAVR